MEINNPNPSRDIDILAEDVGSWWEKTFVYVRKKEITTWKGALVLTFIAGVAVAIIWSAKTSFHYSSDAAAASALYFNPASASVAVGADVDLVATINPDTNVLRAVELHVTYDQTKLTLNSITCSSAFSTTITPASIPGDGTAAAYCGALGTPVTTTSAVATFNFTAIAAGTNLPITFEETSAAAADGEVDDVIVSMTPASVTVTGADTTDPTVSAFAIPETSASLIVPITTFTATDDTAVTGYLVTESSAAPASDDEDWLDEIPEDYSYTFATAGSKTLYAWAKDAAGNVSAFVEGTSSDSVTITIADSTAPVVTAFDVPATASALEVDISTFTASDAVGVDGYIITESSTAPEAGALGWSDTAPLIYVFTSEGSKTLYAWAKDEAGNVSGFVDDVTSEDITITLTDATAPTVSAFAIPATSSSFIVPITTFTATDDTEVTEYLITESSAAPASDDEDWLDDAPENYTFATAGSKTLYAWAKDAAGNVSAFVEGTSSDSVTITIADSTAPTVTAFAIPETASAFEVAISSFTASDSVGVTGYMITENPTAPGAGSDDWEGTAPTSYTFSTAGSKTLYAWAKDAAGNVSASLSDTIVLTVAAGQTPATTTVVASTDKGDNDSGKKKETVKPRTIKNSPKKVARGAMIRQYGKKFSKNSTVMVYFSKYGGGYYAPMQIKTNSSGKFTLVYRVTKPKGTYSWYVVDTKTGKKSRTAYYKVK